MTVSSQLVATYLGKDNLQYESTKRGVLPLNYTSAGTHVQGSTSVPTIQHRSIEIEGDFRTLPGMHGRQDWKPKHDSATNLWVELYCDVTSSGSLGWRFPSADLRVG